MLVATGSRPRVPDFVPVDRERVLTTRDAYPPPEIPEHAIVIGSGVTGVEFTHLFDSLGSQVTLLVSRQQVLPIKDAEVAAVLEEAFLERGISLLKGARADARRRATATSCACAARTAGSSRAPTRCSRSARSRTARASGSTQPGVDVDDGGYVPVNHNCLSNVAAHLRRGRRVGEAAAVVGGGDAGPQDRRAPHGPAQPARTATSTTTRPRRRCSPMPEIADVGLAEAEAFAEGRKIRVTKVPFTANAKALIKGDPRGFVKIISDPATGVVLGGSIVGRNAAELISVLAVAVTNGLQGRRHRRLAARAPVARRAARRRRA